MKKIIVIPTICFAVLSTPAFEKEVAAAMDKETPAIIQNNESTMKYVNVDAGSTLNVRKSESTTSSVVTKLGRGTKVTVYSEKNGWAKINANDKTGYVSTKYLTVANQTVSKKEESVIKYVNVKKGSSLNLRNSPSTNSGVLANLPSGKEVTVTSESNGWSKVKVDGKTGYVSTSYISGKIQSEKTENPKPVTSPVKVQAEVQYVNVNSGSNLNMRSKASTSASIISKLHSGEKVSVISSSNGWSKVSANGKEGYVSSQYLTSTKGSSTKEEKKEIVVKTTKGYVNVKKGSSLNMRSNPSTSASIIVKLPNDAEVVVFSESNGWTKVKAYGKEGYVSSQYLDSKKQSHTEDPKPEKVTTTKYVDVDSKSRLNMRKSASTSSTVITTLEAGTEVKVASVSGDWANVEANGKKGYVSVKFLANTKPQSNAEKPQNEQKEEETLVTKAVKVAAGSSLNMRNKPTINASVVVKLANGVVVNVLSESKGWSKINVYNHTGYVSSEFLSAKTNSEKPEEIIEEVEDKNQTDQKDQTDEKNDEPIVDDTKPAPSKDQKLLRYVNVNSGSSLNMRSEGSTTASIVSKLSRGTVVEVLSESDGWTKVSANGKIGFVSSDFLIASAAGSSNASEVTKNLSFKDYEFTLEEMLNKQMEVNPQTDKSYETYIREDALIIDNPIDPTSGVVQGSAWNLRGGAGTDSRVIGTVKVGETLKILSQVKGKDGYVWYAVKMNSSWVNASKEDVSYYVNPNNFIDSPVESLQFLKLSKATEMNETEVNGKILASKGILAGKASAFIQAGNSLGINELYLISHALLETGNGTSQLAKGVEVNGRTVYNMYGIGAYDGSALSSGSKYAYEQGWFTPEAAIIGGAEFIAKGYISKGQDTLYKMRWNPESIALKGAATHQYASDIGWATKQVNQIHNLYSLLDSYKITLEIPKYK